MDQFVKSQKKCVFFMPSLSIKVSNGNQLYGTLSSQRLVLLDPYLIFDRTHLADAEESLCGYPMVIDITYWR